MVVYTLLLLRDTFCSPQSLLAKVILVRMENLRRNRLYQLIFTWRSDKICDQVSDAIVSTVCTNYMSKSLNLISI